MIRGFYTCLQHSCVHESWVAIFSQGSVHISFLFNPIHSLTLSIHCLTGLHCDRLSTFPCRFVFSSVPSSLTTCPNHIIFVLTLCSRVSLWCAFPLSLLAYFESTEADHLELSDILLVNLDDHLVGTETVFFNSQDNFSNEKLSDVICLLSSALILVTWHRRYHPRVTCPYECVVDRGEVVPASVTVDAHSLSWCLIVRVSHSYCLLIHVWFDIQVQQGTDEAPATSHATSHDAAARQTRHVTWQVHRVTWRQWEWERECGRDARAHVRASPREDRRGFRRGRGRRWGGGGGITIYI